MNGSPTVSRLIWILATCLQKRSECPREFRSDQTTSDADNSTSSGTHQRRDRQLYLGVTLGYDFPHNVALQCPTCFEGEQVTPATEMTMRPTRPSGLPAPAVRILPSSGAVQYILGFHQTNDKLHVPFCPTLRTFCYIEFGYDVL